MGLREHIVTSLRTADGQDHAVVQQRQPRETFGRQFVILFTEQLDRLASKITQGLTLKVMLKLPARLSFTDWRPLNQAELAKELGTAQGNISKALRQLLALNVVERKGTGSGTTWRLSDDVGWRGNPASYHKHRRGKGKLAPMPDVPPVNSPQSHNAYSGNPSDASPPVEQKQSRLRLLGVVKGPPAK